MNRTTFLAYARRAPFGGRLKQSQINYERHPRRAGSAPVYR